MSVKDAESTSSRKTCKWIINNPWFNLKLDLLTGTLIFPVSFVKRETSKYYVNPVTKTRHRERRRGERKLEDTIT